MAQESGRIELPHQDAEASNENTAIWSLPDEIVRNGARQMLAADQ